MEYPFIMLVNYSLNKDELAAGRELRREKLLCSGVKNISII